MLATTVAIQVSRCALLSMCPTNEEIRNALRDADNKAALAEIKTYRAQHPREIFLAEPKIRKIDRIDDVHCGDKSSQDATTVTCSFTVILRNEVTYEVAEMARREGSWVIGERLRVVRKIKHD